MVIEGLASAGKVTVPFGTITCSATAKLTSRPARLPLESGTALASIRMYKVWFGCNSWSNTTTKVRHETFSEVPGRTAKPPSAYSACAHPASDPATEFVHKSTVRVPSNWISSSNVELRRLAKDTLDVGTLLGDNASARSVGGELSAGTTTAMETDVPAETPDMSMTAVLGTSTSKTLVGCLDRAHQDVCTCGVPSIF